MLEKLHTHLHIALSLVVFLFIIIGISFSWIQAFADTTSSLRPVADGSEDSADWVNTSSVACTATNCYTEVDESSGSSCTNSDGDTTYIESAARNKIQTFDLNLSSIPDGGVISQIDIAVCSKQIGSNAELKIRNCIDGSCSNGATLSPSSTYTENIEIISGLSLQKNGVTDIEIGVLPTKNKLVRVSQISAVITYTFSNVTAPAAVADLATSNAAETAIDLDWTAPGDDGSTGTAARYDIRYSTSLITSGNFDSATQVTGEPTPSVAGSAEAMTVSGLSNETLYYFAMKTDDEVPNTSTISNIPSAMTLAASSSSGTTIPSGGSGGVSPTGVKFSGRAYPGSTIEVLRKGDIDEIYTQVPIENSTIDEEGNFTVTFDALLQSQYFFALRVIDVDERKTGIISFVINLLSSNNLVAENIFVSPTIEVKNEFVQPGNSASILGYTIPNGVVIIEVDGEIIGEVESDENGFYAFSFNISTLNLGTHHIRAQAVDVSGIESNFSLSKTFSISTISAPEADFNNDGTVNITDWSVFLFRWGSHDEGLRGKIDMNSDGIINIGDFSIFLKNMQT